MAQEIKYLTTDTAKRELDKTFNITGQSIFTLADKIAGLAHPTHKEGEFSSEFVQEFVLS